MGTIFLRSGDHYRLTDELNLDMHKMLPVGTYMVKCSPEGELYLEMVEDFTLPPKLYGDTERHAQRILTTFNTRDAATGVMLNGEKGSGKSLLAKRISTLAASQGNPLTGIVRRCGCYGEKKAKNGDREWIDAIFTPADIIQSQSGSGKYNYKNADGYKLTLRKKTYDKFDLSAY